MSQDPFSTLNLHPDIIRNIATLGYRFMTPIQAQSLPFIIDGKDVIGQGKTGSGKTAAFGLGVLNSLNVKLFRVQSLILCPTRELADQVAKEVRKLGRTIHNIKVLTLCGGVPLGPQVGSLEHGAHIIVGTPGRIEDHLRKGTLNLEHVKTLVLDEADRMLDMGFQSALDAIVEQVPKQRQTLLFSATFPDQIQKIAQRIMKQPVMAKVEETHDSSSIKQYFYTVESTGHRFTALQLLLLNHSPTSTVVFCNTKRETQEVADQLIDSGFSALALHGDLEQKDRDKTLVRFANRSISVLVATDVAARGLDIDSLDAVINYHIARDPEIHIHRIGRTGRAGSKGIACSLFAEKEHYKVSQLEKYINLTIEPDPLPSTTLLGQYTYKPPMETLQIDGGKKQKLRAGDILGALTGHKGIAGAQVGKIDLFENRAYVAVNRGVVDSALAKLTEGRLKGRSFKVRLL
ncbi:MAG: ATP-dependent RNA helicase DbpA [Methylococcaceae bacterium]|nr:ATP-dependent RNA helicase DbpA [Methylococcaceae bacterium]